MTTAGGVTVKNCTFTQTYTAREKVLAERAAYRAGRKMVHERRLACASGDRLCAACERDAVEAYPLPKVEKPRVLCVDGFFPLYLRVANGNLEYCYNKAGPTWHLVKEQNFTENESLREDFNLIIQRGAELLANPSELVEDDTP